MGSATQRQIICFTSAIATLAISLLVINFLSSLENSIIPELYFKRISVCFFGFMICLVGGWLSYRTVGLFCIAVIPIVLVFFTSIVTKTGLFLWFIPQYVLIAMVLYKFNQDHEGVVASTQSRYEKTQIEKNALTASYKSKGEAISVLFEKYSTYYNMRKLAEDLASILSVHEISQLVVKRSMDFIMRGTLAMVLLKMDSGDGFPVVAFHEAKKTRRNQEGNVARAYQSDLFDQWVIQNRKHLIVTDSTQDFRFDPKEVEKYDYLRSVIVAPIIHDNSVMGTLRINSDKPMTFSNDDLRILDAISVLLSSALSNAKIFEQTKELAIKDSLTGLYVRRHFFERFKDEHRRALRGKKNLSVVMCDVDYFKKCNDQYGHAIGDMILVHVAKILSELPEGGFAGRYGGEEFILLLPETPYEEAKRVAENVRQKIEKSQLVVRRQTIPITISAGVSSMPQDTLDLENLVEKADQALYKAKGAGRNRVC